jgi:hypothetical protein
MTPWQLRCCARGHNMRQEQIHDMNSWHMYHGAALTRSMEKMPPLKLFMSGADKKKVKGIDEAAIMQGLKSYQRQIDGNRSKN